jgi:hypothetical protein
LPYFVADIFFFNHYLTHYLGMVAVDYGAECFYDQVGISWMFGDYSLHSLYRGGASLVRTQYTY